MILKNMKKRMGIPIKLPHINDSDKTTKIARVAVLTELMSRPFFKRKCDEMGMSYTEFVQKSETFMNLSK